MFEIYRDFAIHNGLHLAQPPFGMVRVADELSGEQEITHRGLAVKELTYMYTKEAEIAALVSSRICHDLASPIGAISNGLELLELSGITATPEIQLLSESVGAANARLQFFRIAFGAAASGMMLGAQAAQQLLAEYFADKRGSVAWAIGGDTPRDTAKLLFLLIQCADSALPFGGEVQVEQAGTGWRITGKGRTKMDAPVWQVFSANPPELEITSNTVHFELAVKLAAQSGFVIKLMSEPDGLSFDINRL